MSALRDASGFAAIQQQCTNARLESVARDVVGLQGLVRTGHGLLEALLCGSEFDVEAGDRCGGRRVRCRLACGHAQQMQVGGVERDVGERCGADVGPAPLEAQGRVTGAHAQVLILNVKLDRIAGEFTLGQQQEHGSGDAQQSRPSTMTGWPSSTGSNGLVHASLPVASV